ncbi:sulfurtransferase complex subunit TusB [Vibrio maerlii]|uniref:sulfurtransferase complex subunit TusB n=1 Tax=Vibrio maerlii TaxID=2231648 RepID=UPI000E3E6BE0|nr:sulfurtransferase complex subunit TusB [Vibrio maerlii]
MLHIVKSTTALSSVLLCLGENDAVLLCEQAVTAANSAHHNFSLIASHLAQVHLLESDIAARGLSRLIDNNVSQVDFSGFVKLTEQHTQSMTWD